MTYPLAANHTLQQLGKPTSDEMKKMEVGQLATLWTGLIAIQALKKFQEAHPELDFSNAKIS
jgi:hypothetical protein